GRLVCEPDALASIECLLSPTICFHCFGWHQHSRLPAASAITAAGRCFRYGSGNMSGLESLWEFTMRELIFIGPQKYVLAQQEKAIDEVVALLDECGLAYEIRRASDPFFSEDYAAKVNEQLALDLKYEIRARLPYRGDTLAIGSFNYHQDL